MDKEFILSEDEKLYFNDKTVKKIARLEKLKLLGVYISIKERYEKKHIAKMNEIDNILLSAPNSKCKTYDEADYLTDESFRHFSKAKKLNAFCTCAKRYKDYKTKKGNKIKQ